MAQLHWKKSKDGKAMGLYAGCNTSELATIMKREKWWEAIIWLEDCTVAKKYGPLEQQIAALEKAVGDWFALAETNLPAMDDPAID